jgi:uncharacterized protein (DUF2147 family)
VALLLVLAAGGARAQSVQDVTGMWLNAGGNGGILIAPCGSGELCGSIAWAKDPADPVTHSKFDVLNPNTALRGRLLCGLQILGGFTPNSDGSWGGGWIYDPESGNTYKSKMHLADDGTLHVRGYIGIALLGRTEVWTRPSAPLTPCTAKQ